MAQTIRPRIPHTKHASLRAPVGLRWRCLRFADAASRARAVVCAPAYLRPRRAARILRLFRDSSSSTVMHTAFLPAPVLPSTQARRHVGGGAEGIQVRAGHPPRCVSCAWHVAADCDEQYHNGACVLERRCNSSGGRLRRRRPHPAAAKRGAFPPGLVRPSSRGCPLASRATASLVRALTIRANTALPVVIRILSASVCRRGAREVVGPPD